MGLDPTTPEMVLLLVMLHTGTMFAVIAYFWRSWRDNYFRSREAFRPFALNVMAATVCTGVLGLALKWIIEHGGAPGAPKKEVEQLFGNLGLIAGALGSVGLLIIYAGIRAGTRERSTQHRELKLLGTRAGSGWCRRCACLSGASPAPARRSQRACCWVGQSSGWRNSASRWPWCLPRRSLLWKSGACWRRQQADSHPTPSLSRGSFLPGLLGMVFSFAGGPGRAALVVALAGTRPLAVVRFLLPGRGGGCLPALPAWILSRISRRTCTAEKVK